MNFLTIAFWFLICVYDSSAIDIMQELKRNILNFGNRVNFKYEGMLSHSFDRFYVLAKFELPKVEDLKLTTIDFDSNCSYLDGNGNYLRKLLRHYLRIMPYNDFYKRQITYCNITAHRILTKDIGLILPTFPTEKRSKRAAILASVLGGIASSMIGLAYEGISSFLHKALHKTVNVMEKTTDLQHNKIHHLEDTMIMYGVYNSNTLTELIDTFAKMQNTTTWKGRTFTVKLNQMYQLYLNEEGMHHFAITSVLFLTTIREKYVKMYERFIEEIKTYSKAIGILSKGYLPKYLLPPSKLERILNEVRIAITKSNKDYDLVLTRLYLYYDMKLIMFGLDNQRNLIVQFPVFVQPYTQNRLIMYQIETVPVPILDENYEAQSYTQLKIHKPYIALNTETYIMLHTQELKTCKKIGYEYFCEELFVVKSKTRYSCASVIYFDLGSEIIKDNCEFKFYFNKTDVKPIVLDGGYQIILANWPSYKRILCSHNNIIPINIPSHPYVLMNRSLLCNCDVEAESNFLLGSLAVCENSEMKMDLEMYLTVNLAFVDYFDKAIEDLDIPILRNWTTQEQILPLSIEIFKINPNLLNAPKTLKDLVNQYKNKRKILEIQGQREIEKAKKYFKFASFLNSFLADILLFSAAL